MGFRVGYDRMRYSGGWVKGCVAVGFCNTRIYQVSRFPNVD